MQLGIGLSISGVGARRYDADDLASGTLSLNFVATNDVTLVVDFVAGTYRAWIDDPSWPYGVTGVFKGKA
ncbi:hypothetical protein [Cupriavidus basilensis]|uniref:hypothetical protein n=1 Tax=Cupriavidus basilensis TaxID=68895 RepID=UPI000750DFD8|nr:hypothetical protein [Cupriavidus basilensis]